MSELMSEPQVLVIDDEEHILTLLRHELGDAGYEVFTAQSGQEGLKLLRTARPQAIITDLMMPEMSGSEVTQRIKADPATRHLPVIILSVLEASLPDQPVAADAYLTKPVDIEKLLKTLETLMQTQGR